MLHVQPHDMLTTEHNMALVIQHMNLLMWAAITALQEYNESYIFFCSYSIWRANHVLISYFLWDGMCLCHVELFIYFHSTPLCVSHKYGTVAAEAAQRKMPWVRQILHMHTSETFHPCERACFCVCASPQQSKFLIEHFNWLTHSQLETIYFLISQEINDLMTALNLHHTFILACLWH